jgi:hypothetical protein
MMKESVLVEVLSKRWYRTLKERWETRPKGAKSALRFMVGAVGFTVGYALLRSAVAVQETMLDIKAWWESRKEKMEEA